MQTTTSKIYEVIKSFPLLDFLFNQANQRQTVDISDKYSTCTIYQYEFDKKADFENECKTFAETLQDDLSKKIKESLGKDFIELSESEKKKLNLLYFGRDFAGERKLRVTEETKDQNKTSYTILSDVGIHIDN